MFSQSINSAPGTVRSKRRPRPHSTENSVTQPKAKRQRNALNDQTFIPPSNGAPEMEQVRPETAVATLQNKPPTDLSTHMQELTVRSKKRRVVNDRINKGDGSTVLTSNEIYTVSKLPALPDRLRPDEYNRQHGAIYSDSGYALSLSHTHAVVWPYSVNTTTPETFTFTLPQASKHTTDALPLGTLVSASASEHEPGLVVVMPMTGKICYWESISSAATLDLIRKKQNGLEGSVPTMMSGEIVLQILNAETAGFVLSLSTGRVAYMSVRDGQGRPAINVQFLRSGLGPYPAIFGSMRNYLPGSWGEDIAAIRAGPSTKVGEREVVMATSKGKIQAWKLHRGGHNSLVADLDLREEIVTTWKRNNLEIQDLPLESFEILDLAFSPLPAHASQSQETEADEKGMELYLLTAMNGRTRTYYALVEITLGAKYFTLDRVITASAYTTPVNRAAVSKPRIYLPSPAVVAFLVFDRSVVVLSMTRHSDTPEMQLLSNSQVRINTFEDVIDLRDDLDLEIIGSGEEEPYGYLHGEDHKSRKHRAKSAAAVLIVKGAGLIRIAVIDTQKLIASTRGRLSAKSKLEQAAFFRMLENNPLSFKERPELQCDTKQIGKAALELSEDIIDSKTSHVSSVSANLEQHLRKRALALSSLADHLKEVNVPLDRATRWRLMTDAEKLNGALRMWETYEALMKVKPAEKKEGLLTQIVEFVSEKHKTEPMAENGEVDRVRFWFIKDISRIDNVIEWAMHAVRVNATEEWEDSLSLAGMLTESEDYVIGVLGTAYKFREEHLKQYGLQNETLKNGIVKSGLEDLPEPWTGTGKVCGTLQFLVTATRSALSKQWSPDNKGPETEILNKMRTDHCKLVDIACRTIQEHYQWSLAQTTDPDTLAIGIKAKESWLKYREELIVGLADIEKHQAAIDLATAHEVLPALANVLYTQLEESARKMHTLTDEEAIQEVINNIKEKEANINSLFERFGDRWASAVFEEFADVALSHKILLDTHKEYVTRFLRSKTEFAKIAWINEVNNAKDIKRGAEILLDLGAREQNLWSKKVELSMGKLASLAGGKKYSQKQGLIIPDGGRADVAKIHNELDLIKIQEQAFEWILPVISAAIDERAEIELAIHNFGNKEALSEMRVFPIILKSNLTQLIAHKTLDPISLIDLLTLMGSTSEEQNETTGQKFYLALKILRLVALSKEEQALNEKIIWRRCFIHDDWSEVNNTVLKDDEETAANLGRTALFSTLKACLENREFTAFHKKNDLETDFYQGMFEQPTQLHPMGPSEVFGTCSDKEDLGLRFAEQEDSAKMALVADMKIEDDRLEVFMETCQLEKWWQECLTLAKESVDADVHQKTIEGAEMKKAAEDVALMEAGHCQKQRHNALKNARSLAKLHTGPGLIEDAGGWNLKSTSSPRLS